MLPSCLLKIGFTCKIHLWAQLPNAPKAGGAGIWAAYSVLTEISNAPNLPHLQRVLCLAPCLLLGKQALLWRSSEGLSPFFPLCPVPSPSLALLVFSGSQLSAVTGVRTEETGCGPCIHPCTASPHTPSSLPRSQDPHSLPAWLSSPARLTQGRINLPVFVLVPDNRGTH